MLYKYLGDTIRAEVHLEDFGGTALDSETPIFSYENNNGSNVFNGTGTFDSDGTYYVQKELESTWGTGPAKYWWNIKGANGTAREVVTNELLVLEGTTELPAYVYQAELTNYYGIINQYDMTKASFKITERYHYINRRLETYNIKTPRLKNDDGQFDYSLRAANAWYAIYDIVQEEQLNNVPEDDKDPWYSKFLTNAEKIMEDIKKRKIVFRDQVSPAESGISMPSRVAGSSIGTMFTNWDNSYGNGFKGADFDRTWSVEITGTGTASGLFECTAVWSNDDGQTFGSVTTDYDWIELQDEVFIRFKKGTASGTTNIFNIGDKWEFNTEPLKRAVGGNGIVKSY